ncbi:transglycosylase SLT domain-containing protein [Pseudomonas sp. PDM20]|uniref:transglycosylase SLT domain-containing protein n=1 Tax=Pseudomonas sp. PDM20 TaxID=2769254 RepID=UPI00177CDB40|nr:transglycosylase SLT domain-containing protein [Pseudomonas sp. PDM20]MBD9686837.1 transglycosylase SLT domain-containing protein [Pseudomonas sp. PDM20]
MTLKPLILASTLLLGQHAAGDQLTAIPDAYLEAAATKNIPPVLLYAIAEQESVGKLNIGFYPWPWTLNVAGQGMRFATRQEACSAALNAIQKHGGTSVDIGIAQQNWGWTGKRHYSHPCDALNPYENLRVAAVELRKCFDARGDWLEAAGCYHRPAGGEPARRYKELIAKRLQRLKFLGANGIVSVQ